MPQTWINFRELREKLSFADIIRHYNVQGSVKGTQHHGFCPLPNHQGKRNSPSFTAHLAKGVFHCFGCQAKGNILEFACLMEGANPEDKQEFRQVALFLAKTFGVGTSERVAEPVKAAPKAKTPEQSANAPLDFELKGLDSHHPYLLERGFTKDTLQTFGLGFCNRGYLKGRVAIPLHSEAGNLVGYAGRIIDDSRISADEPKYKFPTRREHEGTVYEFRKLDILYNVHRLKKPLDHLIVVEGFPALWWLHQHGFPNVVALMGAVLSRKHEAQITERLAPTGIVWLMPDGNDAGMRCAETAVLALSRNHNVRWVKLTDDKQPTDLSRDELQKLLPLQGKVAAPASIKDRLRTRSLDTRQAIVELANSFPALRFLGLSPESWDPELVDVRSASVSSTERAAAQFILAVWNPRARWNCGTFNALDALTLWDTEHRKAFISWAEHPWWP